MGAWEFVAGQLRSPSGAFGRHVMPRFFNRSSAAINQTTLAALALEAEDRVLEVGFGGGELIANIEPFVPEGAVAGVDFSPDMVAAGEQRFASLIGGGRLELRCARAEELPYADGRFTKACTVNTVYFWPDPAVPLKELWRVLEPGGRLAVSFSIPAAIRRLPVTKHGFTLYEPDRVRELLQNAGFGDIRMVPGTGRRGDYMCGVATRPAWTEGRNDTDGREPSMNDESKCTEVGCMTPAQVVQCAEGSTTECWIAATMVAEDGSEVAYECCGGGGKKARFSLLKRGAPARPVSPAEVPSSLTWIRRTI